MRIDADLPRLKRPHLHAAPSGNSLCGIDGKLLPRVQKSSPIAPDAHHSINAPRFIRASDRSGDRHLLTVQMYSIIDPILGTLTCAQRSHTMFPNSEH